MHDSSPRHLPVLVEEALAWLRVRPDGAYVDCTVGLGGHAVKIAEKLDTGRLIALDRDPSAVDLARKRLAAFSCTTVYHRNYSELASLMEELGIGGVDGVLLDAGVSSMQLDDPGRGFSFQQDGPLDMRMDSTQPQDAARFLRGMDERTLADLLRRHGDVGPAKRIAAAILSRRDQCRLNSTSDLAEAVREGLPFVHGEPDEIRTVFQAIRIAVNDELGCLQGGIKQAIDMLAPGGRLVVIAFHSGEDRIVKNTLRDASRVRRELHPDGRVKTTHPPRVKVLTSAPVYPGEEEARMNPRSRSARLRAAERLANKEKKA